MLRAYDKATGADAGAVYMPAPQTGSPMTYMLNGKQYIVVAIGGSGYSAELARVPTALTGRRHLGLLHSAAGSGPIRIAVDHDIDPLRRVGMRQDASPSAYSSPLTGLRPR